MAKKEPPSDEAIAMGARIRGARLAVGLSQSALAKKVGVESQTISLYERGKIADPKMHVVLALSDALGRSVEWLVRGADAEVREERPDTPAWTKFRERGYPDLFERRGATAAQIEYARRAPLSGEVQVTDYVALMEAVLAPSDRAQSAKTFVRTKQTA